MATATKKATRKKTAKKAAASANGNDEPVRLQPILRCRVRFGIRGTSPIIFHAWDVKAEEELAKKHAGKKTKERGARDPEAEYKAAMYITERGEYALPGMALKKAIINAAHKDLGIDRTLVKKSLFLVSKDEKCLLPMECSDPEMRKDLVRVPPKTGSADLRYRPMFREWACLCEFEVDRQCLQVEDLLTLVGRAGFGIGIGEWRPEKDGEFGRFELDPTVPWTQNDL